MNVHDEIRKELSAFSGGDLAPAERCRVEAHLAACAACRAELAELETVRRLLRTTPEADPPPWLTTRIMARVRDQQQEKRGWLQRFFLPLHVKLPIEVAALLLVSASGYYLARNVETELDRPAIQGEAPAQAPQATPPDPAIQSKNRLRNPPPTRPPTVVDSPLEPAAPDVIERNWAAPMPVAPSEPAPRPAFAPAPPPATEERAVPTIQPLQERSMSADRQRESVESLVPTAPKAAKKKAARAMEQEMSSFKAFDGASNKGAVPVAPPITIRLRLDQPVGAPDIVREAISSNGGAVIQDGTERHHGLKARIPAARLTELLKQLERHGTIVERPQQRNQAGNLEIEISW